MNATFCIRRSTRHRLSLLLLSAALFGMPTDVHAICGLDGAVREQLRSVNDPEAVRALSRRISARWTSCFVCHLAELGGPRNEYGNAINTLLTFSDREDPVRQRDAGRRIANILANPLLPNSPTFGELFSLGRFPAPSLMTEQTPLPEVPVKVSESITAQQGRELVQNIEKESRFGILQLSNTHDITPEAAAALAEFRGEILILGLKSLRPEVAAALAKSQAAKVWLHSVTSVSPAAAEAIVKLRGHLVLTGLAKLDSVPLAAKLATRPGALSFPYLKTITPEIAAALAKNVRSLTLAGLTDVSPEVQEQLARTVGTLSLPNLKSLDSLPLAKKLAAVVLLLPKVETLTVEKLEQLVGVKGQESFWGSIYLPLAAMTPEVAKALTANPRPGNNNLTLIGTEPLADEVLRMLLKARVKLNLRDVEKLTEGQIRIVAEELAGVRFIPEIVQSPRLELSNLRKLDSALLAETLVTSTGFNFPAVTSISPEVAAALGSLPDQEFRSPAGVEIRPSGYLNFPSLEEFSPETARLLLKKRWLSISLPALQNVSLETVRLMARQTSRLKIGIPALPSEFADAFADTPPDPTSFGGGYIMFPYIKDVSPEAARILVKSLNRGVRDLGHTRLSNSPRLSFGGFPALSPELAVELATHTGILEIQGLGELPDESAAALASFPGPYLFLSGPAAEKLSPKAAESLAKVPGNLILEQLRNLDSVPLAQRFARQITWTLSNLETVSREAAPALSQYKQSFYLRALTVMDSPEIARRFVEGYTPEGITLPALSSLSPEAAEILAAGSKPLYLGLTVLDSPDVVRALSKSQPGVQLPRLRAATPEVLAVLKEAKSIKTPPLDSVYVLPQVIDP